MFDRDSIWRTSYGHWRWPLATLVWGGGALVLTVVLTVAGFIYSDTKETRQTQRGRGDSPVTGIVQDAEGEDIIAIEMPDEFSGFATRCIWEGYRGFSTTNDGGAFVIPDPDCPMPVVVAPEDAHR